MGCLLIVISAVLFFLFPPLGIAVFLLGLVVMLINAINRRSSETAKQTEELRRIAKLSVPPEVQKAEAEKIEEKRKGRRYLLIAAGAVFIVFVVLDWLKYEPSPASSGSPTPTPVATATTTPTPVSTPKANAH